MFCKINCGREESLLVITVTCLIRGSITTSLSNLPLEGSEESSCKTGFQQSKVQVVCVGVTPRIIAPTGAGRAPNVAGISQ